MARESYPGKRTGSMAFISTSRDALKFGSTNVENLFITEYLPSAPDGYVRVYLYALFSAQHPELAEPTLERFAAALGMTTRQVLDAMHYWQRMGIVAARDGEKDGFELLNIRSAMYSGENATAERTLSRYASLNARLAEITRRSFTPGERSRIYDWIECDKMTEDGVAAVFAYCVSKYGASRATMPRVAAVVRDCVQQRKLTGDDVRSYLEQYDLINSPCRAVLRHLGISRMPTMDEHRMYLKWRDEWGFSPEAILSACAELTKIREPNMAYLDRVMDSLHREGLTTAHAVEMARRTDEQDSDVARKFGRALGAASLKREMAAFVYDWLRVGMTEGAALLLCQACAARGKHTFQEADEFISGFVKRGILDEAGVKSALAFDEDCMAVLKALGIERAPTDADRRAVERYKTALPMEVILCGAEYAREGRKPLSLLNAILTRWAGEGVRTVADARESYEKNRARQENREERKKTGPVHFDGESSFDPSELGKFAEEL